MISDVLWVVHSVEHMGVSEYSVFVHAIVHSILQCVVHCLVHSIMH